VGSVQDLMSLPHARWVLLAAAVALGFALSWLWRWYRVRHARKVLRTTVVSIGADHLVDVLVPDGMGDGYHVDFLLLTVHGIVVIDMRQVHGNIFGGDQMAEWTVMDGPRRFTFINPQNGLYDRVAAVKAIAGDVPVEGRVVFAKGSRFPKGLPKWTVLIDSLRAQFPSLEADSEDGTLSSYREPWTRLKSAVTPSTMVHMR